MIPPIYVRPLTEEERQRIEAGLRSSDAFVLRRCQILLASARKQKPQEIADALGCDDETVRRAIADFHERGLACLQPRSSRPHTIATAFDEETLQKLKAMLHQSPRLFDKPTSVWTLSLAAEVAFAEGLTDWLVSDETIRLALKRLDVNWRRAKHWITSPDPEYARKKGDATG